MDPSQTASVAKSSLEIAGLIVRACFFFSPEATVELAARIPPSVGRAFLHAGFGSALRFAGGAGLYCTLEWGFEDALALALDLDRNGLILPGPLAGFTAATLFSMYSTFAPPLLAAKKAVLLSTSAGLAMSLLQYLHFVIYGHSIKQLRRKTKEQDVAAAQ
ncbi:hypothetical protein HDU91_005393 [Kappamyces sp. JEL0680]|nr:hypothetical protein HDU91_005393 [Kappamyces sp. JEL0680]